MRLKIKFEEATLTNLNSNTGTLTCTIKGLTKFNTKTVIPENLRNFSFHPTGNTATTSFILFEPVDEEALESSKTLGNTLGNLNSHASTGAEVGSLLISAVAADPGGLMIKFAQGTKLLTRLRFISIDHGLILRSFLKVANEKYDKQSTHSEVELHEFTNGYKFKFTKFRQPISIFEYKLYHMTFYLVMWILKFYSYFLINKVKKENH